MLSRLARGAWIETERINQLREILGRASQGARGLKQIGKFGAAKLQGRASQGARGLKPLVSVVTLPVVTSRLARGAWIET